MDWSQVFPKPAEGAAVPVPEIADIGCGFGGLLFGLAHEPATAGMPSVGLEIRVKVAEYVRLKIAAYAEQSPELYGRLGVLKANAMRHFANYFKPGQLKKLFICFADPHFKRKNHRRRIVTQELLGEYATAIQPGGFLYTITDVKDLAEWHAGHCRVHPAFEPLSLEDMKADPAVRVMVTSTEEGKAKARDGESKYVAVYRRLPADEAATAAKHWLLNPPALPYEPAWVAPEVYDFAQLEREEYGLDAAARAQAAARKAAGVVIEDPDEEEERAAEAAALAD